MEKELIKIQYHQGVGFIKWRGDDENKICITSSASHKDPTISLWDIKRVKYPESVLRGHKDIVTSCCFDRQQ